MGSPSRPLPRLDPRETERDTRFGRAECGMLEAWRNGLNVLVRLCLCLITVIIKHRKSPNHVGTIPVSTLPQRTIPVEIGFSTSESANLIPAFLHRFDRAHTRRAYESDLVQFFGTNFVDVDHVRGVSFLHVNQHIADMEVTGAAATTIRRRIAAIRGFFEWLVALDVVDRNPANRQVLRRVRSASRRDRAITFLSQSEATALVQAADTDDEAALRRRLAIAPQEMAHYPCYDYVIVNDDFEEAMRQLQAIVVADRCRVQRLSHSYPIFAELAGWVHE